MPDHERREDPFPRYTAPQAIATTQVPQPDAHTPAVAEPVTEGDRAAVPDNPSPMIAVEQSVVTSDGHEIGHVKEVTDSFFKVDASMRSDYWISADDVEQAGTDIVTLKFPHDELDAHTLDGPSPGDSLLSADQQLDQRKAMEAELDAQRGGPEPVGGMRKEK